MKKFVPVIGAVVILSLMFACGGGGGGGSTNNSSSSQTQLSGTISSSSPAAGLKAGRAPAPAADSVWAVPIAKMQGANVDAVNFILHKTSSLDANGNFSFSLEKTIKLSDILAKIPSLDTTGFSPDAVFDVDWLLVEMAGKVPLNVVALKGDSTFDSMLTIPLSVFTPTNMNLGLVSSGVSSLGVSDIAGSVSLSTGSLKAIARSDKILKSIKDIIRNCDLTTNKCISARQSFVFMGVYSNLTITYDKAGSYSGYQFSFDLTDYYTSADFDGICPSSGTTATVVYQLAPPSPVSVESVTYSSSHPFSSGTVTGTLSTITSGTATYTECFKSSYPLYLRKNNNNASDWSLQIITGDQASQLTKATPAGDWILSRNSATIGQFEFALANPIDTSGNPIVFIPAVRFDTDGATPPSITTIHVKWYQWIGSGYVEITDAALLNSLMGGYEVSMDDFVGIGPNLTRRSYHLNNISFSTTSIDVHDPTDTHIPFLYGSPASNNNLDYFGVGYQFGGQNFRFAWRP